MTPASPLECGAGIRNLAALYWTVQPVPLPTPSSLPQLLTGVSGEPGRPGSRLLQCTLPGAVLTAAPFTSGRIRNVAVIVYGRSWRRAGH